MSMTNEWRWSWVSDTTDTKRVSACVTPLNINVIGFKQASGGPLNSKELNDFAKSVQTSISSINSYLATYVQPVMNSLPAGGHGDKRFSREASGYKIDAMSYGLQGSTLFVFNDADATKADGRYWVPAAGSLSGRPKTIAEAFEDVYKTIAENLTTTTTSTEVLYPDPWTAINELDVRLTASEDSLADLDSDCWSACGFVRVPGAVSPSMAAYVYHLIQAHDVSDWLTGDPDNITHAHIAVAAHTQACSTINTVPSKDSVSANRAWTPSLLDTEIQRLRYEIQRVSGAPNWYSDIIPPFSGAPSSLKGHVDVCGHGTASSSNPHGLAWQDITNLTTVLEAIGTFTGMSFGDTVPTYSSHLNILVDDTLETAISKLDAALTPNLWVELDGDVTLVDSTNNLIVYKASTSSTVASFVNLASSADHRVWVNFSGTSSLAQVGAGYYDHGASTHKAAIIQAEDREVGFFMKGLAHIGSPSATNYALHIMSATSGLLTFDSAYDIETARLWASHSAVSLSVYTNNTGTMTKVVEFKADQTTDFNGDILMHGTRILTNQQAHIGSPAGGGTVDAEARTAINSILTALETHGLVANS